MKRLLCLVMAVMILLTGCGRQGNSTQLSKPEKPTEKLSFSQVENLSENVMNFSAKIFSHTAGENNSLVSPVSLLYALAMTANGADGQTLAEFEKLIDTDMNKLNSYLAAFTTNMPQSSKAKLDMANAIWFRDNGFTANEDFLDINRNYYGAGVYTAPFDDGTVKDINNFVKDATDGQIDKILDNIPPSTVMYLLNALSFDGEWEEKYKKEQIHDGTFTAYDGSIQTVKMMYSQENRYIEDENTTGFTKDYKGGNYRFVALLPDENTDIIDYVKALTGEKLTNLLNTQSCTVDVGIPQFESNYAAEMKDILTDMGLGSFFNPVGADFSKLGSAQYNLYVSSVIHKTTLTLDDNGTKAAAITLVSQNEGAAAPPEDLKTVVLDRPFVYMIVESQTDIPVFIGTVMTIE
ncbi:MAG: serpin family protein [Oscillospiraceae bacterium]|nr:serpin family protein [Oscillospiraceae bacterium]